MIKINELIIRKTRFSLNDSLRLTIAGLYRKGFKAKVVGQIETETDVDDYILQVTCKQLGTTKLVYIHENRVVAHIDM